MKNVGMVILNVVILACVFVGLILLIQDAVCLQDTECKVKEIKVNEKVIFYTKDRANNH